ncbi:MAG TPA: hypothetical protein VGE34_00065 [Candidatus Saccharimonadales bacterium]
MFDADAGRQASKQKIEARSNRIAANVADRLEELSMDEQEALMDRLDAVVASTEITKEFAAGTYAQADAAVNSAGQPAAALGGGQPGPQVIADEQEALNLLFNSTAISNGVKAALRRLLNPRDPHPLLVEADGTPSELAAANRAKTDAETAKTTAETKLAEERDETHNGSLAHQLAAARAAAVVPTDMVTKATVAPLIEAVEQAAGQLHSGMLSTHVDGADELNTKVAAAKAAVS